MKTILLFILLFAHYSYGQDTTLTKKQSALLKRLKNYRIVDTLEQEKGIFNYSPTESFFFEDYQNPQIKKELMRLLVSKWTETELEAELAQVKREILPQHLDIYVKEILKKQPRKSYRQVYDSLLNWRLSNSKNHYLANPPGVDAEIIKMVGYVYMTESIPLLISQANRYEAQLALARMRVEPYYTELLSKYDPENIMRNKDSVDVYVPINNARYLQYIGTQESLQKIEKWLYMGNKKHIGAWKRYFNDYKTVDRQFVHQLGISNMFPDLRAYVMKDTLSRRRFYSPRNRNVTDEDIQYFKKYFKENKGKIKANKYWY